jgi:hypothetical protein
MGIMWELTPWSSSLLEEKKKGKKKKGGGTYTNIQRVLLLSSRYAKSL